MKITLDSIRDSINEKYSDFEIEGTGVVMCNPLRLSKKNREQLNDIQKRMNPEGEDGKEADLSEVDQFALIGEIVCLVSKDKKAARAFLTSLKDDPDVEVILLEVINQYMGSVQVGEA